MHKSNSTQQTNNEYITIYIFRRDLRLQDNLALSAALSSMKGIGTVLPIFIFTPEQITAENKYRSLNAIRFMNECLEDLNSRLLKYNSKLHTLYGNPADCLNKLIQHLIQYKYDVVAVYVATDYTPYSVERDKSLASICSQYECEFNTIEDAVLLPIKSTTTNSGDIYVKFTPYFEKIKQRIKKGEILRPSETHNTNMFTTIKIPFAINISDITRQLNNNELALYPNVIGGRNNALNALHATKSGQINYDTKRDILCYNTSNLSAYIKFGCISIREVFWYFMENFGQNSGLIKQLFWREFYYNITAQYPQTLRGKSLKTNYDNIVWENNKDYFIAWTNGKTGFPIVDACMRQLNSTGYMHNRGRLIVSNFLIKILLIDWRWGEKYFATKLIDYDPINNNGGWTWSSGSGADSQPYFRIFNPMLQSERFDKDAKFIKKWVPELTNIDPDIIHKWPISWNLNNKSNTKNKNLLYIRPIVDYNKQKEAAIKMYGKAFVK